MCPHFVTPHMVAERLRGPWIIGMNGKDGAVFFAKRNAPGGPPDEKSSVMLPLPFLRRDPREYDLEWIRKYVCH